MASRFITSAAGSAALAVGFAFVAATAAAAAATITVAAVPTYSLQGQQLSGANAVQGLPVLTVILGSDYAVDDNVTLRIVGASVGGATNANLTTPANIACNGGPAIIVSFVTRSGNDISLRVTQKNVLNTVGVQCTISGIELTSPSLDAVKDITASWSATTALTSIAFDAGGPIRVAAVADQFRVTVTKAFDAVVNVSGPSYRTRYLTDDGALFLGPEERGDVRIEFDNRPAIFTGPAVEWDAYSFTILGDFSQLDTNGDGDCSNDPTAGILGTTLPGPFPLPVGPPFAFAPAADCRSLVARDDYVTGLLPGAWETEFAVTLGRNGRRIIVAPQSFAVRVTASYHLGAVAGRRTEDRAFGAWTLNGFQAFVDYMPYGANVSQTIYLANKGAQTGEIQVDARSEAGAACSFAAGTAGANRVQVLSAAIQSGLEGCYGAGFTGKVQLTLTAAIPQGEAELYTGYTVNGTDRPVVVNSSNGR